MSIDLGPYELLEVAKTGSLKDLLELLETEFFRSSKPCDATSSTMDTHESLSSSTGSSDVTASSTELCKRKTSTTGATNSKKGLSTLLDSVTNGKGETTLWLAVAQGHEVAIQTVISAGADVNQACNFRQTPLMLAVQKGRNLSSVGELRRLAANANLVEQGGTNNLMVKVTNRQENCVQLLLQACANLDAQDDWGRTALMQAAGAGSVNCVQLLLKEGADVGIVDNEGKTALMIASSSGRYACVEVLVNEPTCQIDAMCNCWKTALIYAVEGFKKRCIELLLQAGADINHQTPEGYTAMVAVLKTIQIPTERLSLLKIIVDHKALKVTWVEFQEIINSDNRRILQFLIANGIMPAPQLASPGEQYTSSYVQSVLTQESNMNVEGIIKYFIVNCYLHNDDLRFFSYRPLEDSASLFNSVGHPRAQLLMAELSSQPWPLVKLCFVTVSTLLGESPGRHERIRKSQLPNRLQDMLMFKDPESRLCPHTWEKIPLTFSPEKYEKLPQPRPQLYNWPVGRPLVTCDCGKCDGTMYKY